VGVVGLPVYIPWNRVLATVVGADVAGGARRRSVAAGSRAAVATMDGQSLDACLRMRRVGVDLRELEAGAGIGERGDGAVLHDGGLEFELAADAVEERKSEVPIIDRSPDGGQIVGDALEFGGVV
jgi:hypothetical protein